MGMDVVVLGSSATALYAVRELAMAGYRIGCADALRGCAMASRHLGPDARFVGTPDEVEAWLLAMAGGSGRAPLLLPCSDLFIEFVMARADRLAGFPVFEAYRNIAADLLDKARFHALCKMHGIPTPGVWHAEDGAALRALAGQVPMPCILKPVLIHRAKDFLRGKKVLLARSEDEYLACVDGMPEGLGGWLVQEIVPGPESEISLFAGYVGRDGVPRQAFTARKLRQYPPGFGSASLVTSQPCEETLQRSLSFLAAIGFRGVCGTEFKRDPRDGVLKIIEINPRPTLWFQVAHDAGKRVVESAVRDLLDASATEDAPQAQDVRWRYALKDATSALFYRREGSRFVFPPPDVSGADACRKRSWPVFAWDDPRPALVEPLGFVRKAWKRRK